MVCIDLPFEVSTLNIPFRGKTTRRFIGHEHDVMSVAFSADNRQIVSASRDKTIKLWNTLGVCKYTVQVWRLSLLINLDFLFCRKLKLEAFWHGYLSYF